MAQNRIPRLLKHMTLAIFKKPGIKGATEEDRFRAAFEIARARLTEYGHLVPGSDKGDLNNIRLTGKGLRQEAKHYREPDMGRKSADFDAKYEWLLDRDDED